MDNSGNITSKFSAGLSFDLSDESLYAKDPVSFSAELREHISSFVKNEDLSKIKPGVVIDSSMAFINVIPLDFSETTGALESHIQWELSNYYPESSKDYSKRYYKLGEPVFSNNIYESLIIAIDRKKIRFIKNLCAQSGIQPRNIEIGHFAVEKCITELFGRNVRGRSVILSSVTRRRIESSLLKDGALKFYDYELITDKNPLNVLISQAGRLMERIAGAEVTDLFVYGELSTFAVEKDIGKYLGGANVIHLDLFSTKSPDGKTMPDSSVYAPLAGLALKNLNS
jgi:hypothetical protein